MLLLDWSKINDEKLRFAGQFGVNRKGESLARGPFRFGEIAFAVAE